MSAGALGAMALAGCSKSTAKPGNTPASQSGAADQPDLLNHAPNPRSGGRFVTSDAATFGSFDPHTGIEIGSAYFPRLYNVLVSQAPTRPEFIYYDLAQSFEIPDPQAYVFHIRPAVRVTPNDLGVPQRELDGEDVRATIDRIKTDSMANSYGFARQYIDSVSVAGATATIKTVKPYAWFMSRIGNYANTIAPRELLAGDLSRLKDQAAGAGPLRLISVTEGESAQFERNPNFYRTDEASGIQLPFVDGIEHRVIFDSSTALAAFRAGQTHRYWATGAEARAMGNDVTIAREPMFSFIAFTMNPDVAPWTDPRARRAVSRAIDRQAFVDIVYAGDAQANGLVPWTHGPYALDADELGSKQQPFDVADAKALVSAIGGLKFKMMYPAETAIEEHKLHLPIFLGQMKDAGIEVDQDPQEFGAWVDNYRKINYASSLALNQIYETPELPLDFHTRHGPLGDGSYVHGMDDPEIQAAVAKSKEQTDLQARIAAVQDAQRVIYAKDPMFLPLVSSYSYEAYHLTVHDIPNGVGTTRYSLTTIWLDA